MKISSTTLIVITISIILIIILFCNYDKDREPFENKKYSNSLLTEKPEINTIANPNLIILPTLEPDCITKCNQEHDFCLAAYVSDKESGFREKTEFNKCKTSYELCAVNCHMDIPNLDGYVEHFSEEDKILDDRDKYCESITDPYWRYYCFGARHL
jgi:hypothetical protein